MVSKVETAMPDSATRIKARQESLPPLQLIAARPMGSTVAPEEGVAAVGLAEVARIDWT
jgi:hypothetical protein